MADFSKSWKELCGRLGVQPKQFATLLAVMVVAVGGLGIKTMAGGPRKAAAASPARAKPAKAAPAPAPASPPPPAVVPSPVAAAAPEPPKAAACAGVPQSPQLPAVRWLPDPYTLEAAASPHSPHGRSCLFLRRLATCTLTTI